jgi:hypothetical protein
LDKDIKNNISKLIKDSDLERLELELNEPIQKKYDII